jgi:hypothetical protein
MPAAWVLLAAGWSLVTGLPRAAAADREIRDFAIRVDGKEAGTYHVNWVRQDNGTETFAAQSEVRVTILAIPVYTYSYSGQETWRAGRLQHFESTGKEKSKPFAVKAVAEGDVLRVSYNGGTGQTVAGDVWLTSCLKLPQAERRNGAIALLGCDTGAVLNGQIQFVGNESISLAGQQQLCSHYRVIKAGIPYEVWYDGQERMVRKEWVADDHRTVVELLQVHR